MDDSERKLLLSTIQLLLSWLPDCGRYQSLTENWFDLKHSIRREIKDVRALAERVLQEYGEAPIYTEKK